MSQWCRGHMDSIYCWINRDRCHLFGFYLLIDGIVIEQNDAVRSLPNSWNPGFNLGGYKII